MRRLTPILIALLLLPAAPVLAGEASQRQIANILMGLNHFPGDAEKETLDAMTGDESLSEAERTVARALKNVEHFPADEDKAALMAIANDEDVPQPVRQLARITHDLAHRVSEEDRKILSKIVAE